jgi:hypothetical protein
VPGSWFSPRDAVPDLATITNDCAVGRIGQGRHGSDDLQL